MDIMKTRLDKKGGLIDNFIARRINERQQLLNPPLTTRIKFYQQKYILDSWI